MNKVIFGDCRETMRDLKAQDAQPVANLWVDPETLNYHVDRCDHPPQETIPVYTHPAPKAQPLTQEQIECGASALADSLNSAGYWLRCRGQEKAMYIAHAKATIEAALGVKLEGEAK